MSPVKQYENISVTAFIPWQGKLLVALRAVDDDYLPGHWEQVGGSVDDGETKVEAVVREVKEEAGILVKPTRLYSEFEYVHRSGKLRCEYGYICEIIGAPNIMISSEHQEYKWISLAELDTVTPMSDYMQDVIKKGFAMLHV